MPRTLRNHAILGSDHSVTVRAPELEPGAKVEVVVLVDSEQERKIAHGASFIDAIAGVTIDAPEDYSISFEDKL